MKKILVFVLVGMLSTFVVHASVKQPKVAAPQEPVGMTTPQAEVRNIGQIKIGEGIHIVVIIQATHTALTVPALSHVVWKGDGKVASTPLSSSMLATPRLPGPKAVKPALGKR